MLPQAAAPPSAAATLEWVDLPSPAVWRLERGTSWPLGLAVCQMNDWSPSEMLPQAAA